MKDKTDTFTGDLFTELKKPTCLDSAYEREAIIQRLNNNPVFEENKDFYEWYRTRIGIIND